MFKLGTITDGISRDFEYALDTMVETGLEYVELQYLWEKAGWRSDGCGH